MSGLKTRTRISAYQGSQQSPTITRLDPCFRMIFETTTSAQARTNRKQRNIGNLAKGACGPCPVACRSQGSRNSCAGRGLEGFGRCVELVPLPLARTLTHCKLCKYPATATPSIVWVYIVKGHGNPSHRAKHEESSSPS
eukprot:g17906.t1